MKVTITSVRQETVDAKTFTLEFDEPIVYKPGQFVTFLLHSNHQTKRRSYSFSSSPHVDSSPAITIKKSENGEFSRWWLDAVKPGIVLDAVAPAGVFTINWQAEPRDIFFCAAGSGITPVYSLIKSALILEPRSKLHLFYSNSNRRNAIFYEALQRLQQQFPEQLHIEWLFSNNADLKKARLSTYNLQELLNANLKYNPANALMLTCGPYYYMKMVEITWLTAGFVRNAFRKEIYDPENIIPASKRYYDKEDRLVTIRFNGNNHAVTVKWNETILDAALRHQIALPYNCKAGRCSACVCQLVSGKVWMHYNEVLTHEDEQRGLVLTCTGHPATEGVVISV